MYFLWICFWQIPEVFPKIIDNSHPILQNRNQNSSYEGIFIMSYYRNFYYEDSIFNIFATSTFLIILSLNFFISLLFLAGKWKTFKKAGKPGWAALVPFYRDYCYMDMCFGTGWLFLLNFVPCIGAIIHIIACFKLSRAFRQGIGFGFGLLLLNPIFLLILGFGNFHYYGVDGVGFGPTGDSYDDAFLYR